MTEKKGSNLKRRENEAEKRAGRMDLFGQLTHSKAIPETYAKAWKINKILLWDFLFLGPLRKPAYLTIEQPALCSSSEALMLCSVLWETGAFYVSPRW